MVKFETAHRQLGDDSKCGFLHGHNWKAEIEISSANLNSIGYVIDFKEIKDAINAAFDHKTLLHFADPLVGTLKTKKQKVQVMLSGNPTCELLAEAILDLIIGLMPDGAIDVESIRVKLYENDSSYAEVNYS